MTWFNNLKTGVKVLLSCLIFLMIISLIAGSGIISVNYGQKAFEQLYNDYFISVLQTNKILKGLLQIRINMLTQQIAVRQNDIAEFNKRRSSINEIFQENEKTLKNIISVNSASAEKKLNDDFIALYNQLKKTTDDFENTLQKKNLKENDNLNNRWMQEYSEARNMAETIINLQQKSAVELVIEQKSAHTRVLIVELALFIFAVIMSVIITIILKNSIVNPINKVVVFADKISQGDLRERVELNRKDELGRLADALNKAAENLASLIDNVLIASQSLSQAVNQIASGNQNLSQRTSEQASSLEEIVATIEETTVAIKQNVGNAENAEELAEITAQMSEDGSKIAREAVESIDEINQSSKRIGEIIALINDISFQTNLLALNAAVEAARAGEQGRGFAVVAGEVRNLAHKSANAAKDIGILIQNSIDKVENGTELVFKSEEALKKISKSNIEVSKITSEISAASKEQKQGIDQINVAISEIDTMTQQNAALVEETAAASEQMTNQAQELLAMVEKFKTKIESASKEVSLKTATVNMAVTKNKPNKQKKIHSEKRKVYEIPESEVSPSDSIQHPNILKKMLSLEGFEEF